jgi:hypothetical protein
VHTFYRAEKYAELYISHILCLHGVPKTIIFDRGPQFIADSQLSLPSVDRWTDREGKSDA